MYGMEIEKAEYAAVVATMYETGRDLAIGYRETSKKGLARLYE